MIESELDGLALDIKSNGLRCAIVLDNEGKTVVDGRNRREACRRAGVVPKTRCLRQDENPMPFILSLNVRRRHLDESQRGMVAARIANMQQGTRTDLASIEAKSRVWCSYPHMCEHNRNIGFPNPKNRVGAGDQDSCDDR
jgi:hypothetical protein